MALGSGIGITSQFDVLTNKSLDSRDIFADDTERDALPDTSRYEWMTCTTADDGKVWRLEGGIGNEHWVEFKSGSGGGGGSPLILKPNDSDPSPMLFSNTPIEYWKFSGEDERLWAGFCVPNSYEPEKTIALENIKLFCAGSDPTKRLTVLVNVYLFKDGANPLSLSNATATQVMNNDSLFVPSVANNIVEADVDLAPVGEVDSVAVEPGDFIVFSMRMERSPSNIMYQDEINMINNTLNLNFDRE